MSETSKGYIQYNGLTPMFSLATTWQPGATVKLEDLSKSLGARCKDTECGDTFLEWISAFVSRTPSFSLHLAALQTFENTPTNIERVESQEISVAASQEQAVEKLRNRELGVQSSNQGTEGVVVQGEQEKVKTSRMFTSVAEAKQQQVDHKEFSEPITGDALDNVNPHNRIGQTHVAQPTVDQTVAPLPSNVNQIESTQPNMVVANPLPTLDTTNDSNVSTGAGGILTTRPAAPVSQEDAQAEAFANMRPVDPQVKVTAADGSESTVITGDELQAPVPGAQAEVGTAVVSSAKSVGGVRPAVQGNAGRREITIDHIVRADTPQRSIDAVNECKDRQILKLAKAQLSNTGDTASNKVIKIIDRRLRFLKSRGL